MSNLDTEGIDVIIIGGGRAGLSVGYHLAQRGRRFVRTTPSASTSPSETEPQWRRSRRATAASW
jgi:cation diffusion facilitator CzcD-associated flavoprotein CzcO